MEGLQQAGVLILNAVVSVICSWIVASIYFRKESRAESIAEQIKRALQQTLPPISHPRFFDEGNSRVIYPEEPLPANTDIPHVEFVRLDHSNILPDMRLGLLIKLRDTGFDLDNPQGVTLRDWSGNMLSVSGIGLGYCTSTVHIPAEIEPGPYRLTIELADAGVLRTYIPNRNSQTLLLVVESGGER